jgi:serine protease Do
LTTREALPFVELGDSRNLEVGDRLLAMGAPFGLPGSVTSGILSGKGRVAHPGGPGDYLQTDAAVNPGSSGGPLISMDGKAVGVVAAIKSRSGGFQGVALAVPAERARLAVNDLMRGQGGNGNGPGPEARRAWLGVQVNDIADPEVGKRLGLPGGAGIVVTHLFDNSPAARGGVREGDVLAAVDGRGVRDGRGLQQVSSALTPGRVVEVIVMRDGKARSFNVTPEELPANVSTPEAPVGRVPQTVRNAVTLNGGLTAADLTPALATALGYREESKGVAVVALDRNGLAERCGLRTGMLLLKVDGAPITSTGTLRSALDNRALSQGVLLQVHSPTGGTNYILLRTGR